MIEALKNGTVFAYGLDVYNGEPKIHPEYLKLKNIFLLIIFLVSGVAGQLTDKNSLLAKRSFILS